jgi:hypothetical protein
MEFLMKIIFLILLSSTLYAQTEKKPKECRKKENLYAGVCVRIPKNGEASESHPGWKCKDGFMQKREKCLKMDMPSHSNLSEDGKTWVCKEGYKAYRGSCTKE